MRNNKLARGLCLAILAGVGGGNVAHAQGPAASPTNPTGNRDPVQSHNSRQKTPHSARKESAKRLKKHHQQEQQQHQLDGTKTPQGKKSQAGASRGSNQISASQGGVKSTSAYAKQFRKSCLSVVLPPLQLAL